MLMNNLKLDTVLLISMIYKLFIEINTVFRINMILIVKIDNF